MLTIPTIIKSTTLMMLPVIAQTSSTILASRRKLSVEDLFLHYGVSADDIKVPFLAATLMAVRSSSQHMVLEHTTKNTVGKKAMTMRTSGGAAIPGWMPFSNQQTALIQQLVEQHRFLQLAKEECLQEAQF
jgi:hypothetical protein